MQAVMQAVKFDNYSRITANAMDGFERLNTDPDSDQPPAENDLDQVKKAAPEEQEVNKSGENGGNLKKVNNGKVATDAEANNQQGNNGQNTPEVDVNAPVANDEDTGSSTAASDSTATPIESTDALLKSTSDHSLILLQKTPSSHNRESCSSLNASNHHVNLLAPKRPQRFQPPKRSASNCSIDSTASTRSASTAFRQLRKNNSAQRLQVENEANTQDNRSNGNPASPPGIPAEPSLDADHSQNSHHSARASGFHPHDSISLIGVTDPNLLDLSLGDHMGEDDIHGPTDHTKTTSGSSPLAATGSERSLASRQQRYPVDPNRPKFVPPPPRKSKYQIAEEAALAAAQANQRGPGWGRLTRNLGFMTSSVSQFVENRTSTFSKNLNVVGDLLTNQRDFGGLDDIEEERQR